MARRDAPDDLGLLLQRAVLHDRFRITPIVRMEILYAARTSSEYVQLELELDALGILRTTAPSPTQRRAHYASWPSVPTATTTYRPLTP